MGRYIQALFKEEAGVEVFPLPTILIVVGAIVIAIVMRHVNGL